MPNSPNFDTSALTTKVGQNAMEEVPPTKDKAIGEKGKDGTGTGETAGGAFCGIWPTTFKIGFRANANGTFYSEYPEISL
uniref:Uncharacterized protein n=1 Tax=Globodera pallida TaxID=36090 RepID=A0A183BZB9_GLOPA